MNKTIQRFKGYLNTPLLWANNSVQHLEQLELLTRDMETSEIDVPDQIRLGKLVERFVYYELEQNPSFEILAQSLQVIKDKVTIGEIDCVIKDLESFIHLEIVYKFYLYDASVGPLEIDKWIGPNRNDSLTRKLNKLTQKQLPLIHHPKTISLIKSLGHDAHTFIQKVHFKAQLFVPLGFDNENLSIINKDCVIGFYINFSDYLEMKDSFFYMPQKLDWLIIPHLNVDWEDHAIFTAQVEKEIKEKRSPLCWVKSPYGTLQKIFVVYWKNQ